jgi:hypothetical protein
MATANNTSEDAPARRLEQSVFEEQMKQITTTAISHAAASIPSVCVIYSKHDQTVGPATFSLPLLQGAHDPELRSELSGFWRTAP